MIRHLDDAAAAAVDRLRCPALDRLFYPLSSAADHSLLWVVIGSAREAVGRGKPGSGWRLAAILAAESALTNGLLKSYFRRIRPLLAEEHLIGPLPYGLRRPVTTAFPSGHATSAFTAAAFLAVGDRCAPAYRTLAVLVAGSRVYVRLHHASDVVGGALIGIALGRLARRFAP